MKTFYYSVYGAFMEEYIALKRSLGYKCLNIEYAFRRFDRFVLNEDESSIGLSKALCGRWCEKQPNESGKSWYNRIHTIRGFSYFLQSLNYPSFLPKLPKIKNTYTPYIYSKEEIASLFSQSDKLTTKTTCYNSIVLVIPCLLRLLYGTGMRLGEALALDREDVNLQEQSILVRNSKNGKDRMVPISDSLAQGCKDYLNCRNRFPLRRKTELFFVHPNGEPCTQRQAYRWFRKVLFNAGIPHQGKHQGPHIHHLRHTFCIHTLARMAEAHCDLHYSLPILSMYLGHQSIAATDRYVRLTVEMYPSLMAKVNRAFPLLFPDIYKPTNHETE